MSTPDPGKVLLVDDDSRLTFVLGAYLRQAGFDVRTANDGREGLDIAFDYLPDVIVLDLMMPVMDGMEAIRLLKQNPGTAKAPIIMLTGTADSENLVLALEAGAQEYVVKPFEVSELVARVRSMHRLSLTRRALDRLNDQLASEVDRKTRRLQLLYNYARGLNEAATLDDVLDLVIGVVKQATESERISLMLAADDGEHLVCRRAIGMAPELVERIQIKAVEGIAGQVYSRGKMVSASALGAAAAGLDDRYRTDSFLCTPLICPSENSVTHILGVLNVTEKSNGQPFTQEEIDCVRTIADSAAVAIHNQMSRARLERSMQVLLKTVGRLAEYRDEETASHLERVQEYVRLLATELARMQQYADVLTPSFIDDLYRAAPLHDIGKVGVPDDILTKSGPLTGREFQIMQTHTSIGRRTLELALAESGPVPLLAMCTDIAYCHHEKYDGTGYPRGIAGDQIPIAARILALADAYDALTSRRRYKEPVPHEEAVQILRQDCGTHFDPDVFAAFERCLDAFDRVRRLKSPEPEEAPEPVFVGEAQIISAGQTGARLSSPNRPSGLFA